MIRRAVLLTLALILTACATPQATPEPSGAAWPAWEPARALPEARPAAEGRPGPDGGTILRSTSAQIATGVPYRFSLGHCGLLSPVDLDGSFWAPIDGTSANGRPVDLEADSEMINATEGIVVVIGDEARFLTASGSVVRFERAGPEREFPGCD